jgi:hypothetical protein
MLGTLRWSLSSAFFTVKLSARINAVKPVTTHLSSIPAAVKETELLKLQPYAGTKLQSLKEYLDTFEYILL